MATTANRGSPQADDQEQTHMTMHEISHADGFELVALDLYRDIHKAIRAELFRVTAEAGRSDPASRDRRASLAGEVRGLAALLESHATHEDDHIDGALRIHLPALAERIEDDHRRLHGRVERFVEMAEDAADARGGEVPGLCHHLYLELASFTGTYLEHQDLEERVIMPALEQAIGVEGVGAIHDAIIANIPPEEMAASLAVMLPAMNVDDRVEMLSGMHAGAPPEVFEGVWGLAASVLSADDHRQLGARLGID
jgi:hypothetical protein